MIWVFVLTLFFTDGHTERHRPIFEQTHASDHCRVAQSRAVAEAKAQTSQGLVKGYTLVVCHPE